jgi:hypothetical protein
MVRVKRYTFACPAWWLALAGSVVLAGCGASVKPSGGTQPPASPGAVATKADHSRSEHSHVAPHGGQIQSVGDNHFELVYEAAAGRFVLYVLGSEESKAAPIEATEIALQVRREGADQLQQVKLLAEPQPGETGKASRFALAQPDLPRLGSFTAVARVPMGDDSYRVSFQFVDGKPISAGLARLEGYACPMKCEKDKLYPEPGKCGVCKMTLTEYKGGKLAHADHDPKHAGTFFMAPDNWHHLEGTLVSDHEVRIYLYDNFTQPLDSAAISGELKVQPVNDKDEEVGAPATLPIQPVTGKPYVVAKLPETMKPPYQTEARLQFPKQKQKFLFNFDFKGVQHKD